MLDFIIVALPRSGTTWAANWLTTGESYCVHDPMWETHYDDLDRTVRRKAGDRPLAGISCTGLWRWAEWINAHPARKLVLRRDTAEIDKSLAALGLPTLPPEAKPALDSILAPSADYRELFDPVKAERLWNYLTGRQPFDQARHAELCKMRIEPKFDRLTVDSTTARRLLAEVSRIAAQ